LAFNFPNAPTIGQKYVPSAGIEYVWTGAVWDRTGTGTLVMPAGVVSDYAGATPPPGALLCDGSTFDQSTYPLLYAALGNSNVLPDLRGRVVAGRDNMGGTTAGRLTAAICGITGTTLGAVGGNEAMQVHAHTGSGTTSSANADHQHFISGATDSQGAHSHTESALGGTSGGTAQSGSGRSNISQQTSTDGAHAHNINFWSGGISVNHQHTFGFTTVNAGAGASQNVQPTAILNKIIWTGT
jgi:microcystin-dependent protein